MIESESLKPSDRIRLDTILNFGTYAGLSVADIIDIDWQWMKKKVSRWPYFATDDLVRDYIHGYEVENMPKKAKAKLNVHSEKKANEAPQTVDVKKQSVINDLSSKLLPKKGIVTLNTWIHFGPHKGNQLGVIMDRDLEYVKSIVSHWNPAQVDGLVLRNF